MRKGQLPERLQGIPVTFRIGRYDGGSKSGGFNVEIRCERSGLHIASLDVPLSEAANLFTGREVKATAEWISDNPNIGLWQEVRRIHVPIPEELASGWTAEGRGKLMDYLCRTAERMANVAWGKDWQADREGFNHHRVTSREPRLYEVTVRRWVTEKPRDRLENDGPITGYCVKCRQETTFSPDGTGGIVSDCCGATEA